MTASPARSGTTASAGSCRRLGRASSGPEANGSLPAMNRVSAPVTRGRRRRPPRRAPPRLRRPDLEQQHAERVAFHLAADRLGDLLDALGGILRRDAGEDRRVERGQVAASLGFSLGGVLGSLGRFLGCGVRSVASSDSLRSELANTPATKRDDRGHPHAERDRGTDEVVARELLRQVHLPGDLRDEQDRERRERPEDPVPHRSLDRQEVGHHPGRVGGLRGRDPDPFQDHDRVQQERHGAHPSDVGEPSGLVRRTA